MCDQISDAVLDAIFAQDPTARVACETAIKTGFVMCLGEITTHAFVNFDDLVRQVVKEIGFDSSEKGFDGNTCGVQIAIASQSPTLRWAWIAHRNSRAARWTAKTTRSKRSAPATRA
jgi:S-adenosylmethionine synthetase